MGKKRSAARRAAATAPVSPAPAPIATPVVPLDTHAALVDTPSAPAVRESPTNTQQTRVSHEADASRAPRAASPAHIRADTMLVREPATPDARADTSVAIATPQARADDPIEPRDAPPVSTIPTNTSCDNPRQPHVKRDVAVRPALHAPFPALSGLAAAAAADLATAVARIGPPDLYIASPVHELDQLDARSCELELLAPRTSLAMSVEDIDEELLANIIEDAQRAIRIEARRDVRAKALAEGRERGWNEGLAEGWREARKEARKETRSEERQRERAWQDGYELGRWDGYREGLEVGRTEVSTSPRVDTSVQTDDAPRTTSPTDKFTTASHVDASARSDDPPRPIPTAAVPASSHVNLAAQTDGVEPTHATEHTDAGVQAEPPAPPFAPDDTHSPQPRVQVSTQTDVPRTSTAVRARVVQEIEPDLLTEILAKAIAKGEAAGLKKGKHVGFQDGMEAGWKSGTREGRGEGYTEGKKAGIEEGREQLRLEVSRIPRAVAAVQTDHGPLPTHVDSTMQTIPITGAQQASSTTSPTTIQPCTFIPTSCDDNRTSHMSSTTLNDISMSHNNTSFSWADEASSLPITCTAPLISPLPRDFSVLRSSSARPFDSLKRRARRSQPRPARLPHPSRPFIPISEPIITRRHPVGLRADRPSIIVSSSPSVPHLVKLEAPPLDWQGDPRLQELGRVLRGLGWVRGLGS